MIELTKKLLSIDGKRVSPQEYHEYLIDMLLTFGDIVDYKAIKVCRGENNRCHTNAILYNLKHPRSVCMTGYALSDDGMWRSHSWLITSNNILIETTVPRVLYFGRKLLKMEIKN